MSEGWKTGVVTRGALKTAEKRKVTAERAAREEKRFLAGNTVGPNDIRVNQDAPNIKITTSSVENLQQFEEPDQQKNEQNIFCVEEIVDIPVSDTELVSSGYCGEMEISTQETNKDTAIVEPTPEEIPILTKVISVLMEENYLDLNALLGYRLVCHEWRQGIDTYFEKDGLELKYTFHNISTITEFLLAAENFAQNPFLGRSASFTFPFSSKFSKPYTPTTELWGMVEKVLSKHGQELRQVTIHHHQLELTPLKLYKLLEKCLPHLKNLRKLKIVANPEYLLYADQNEARVKEETKLLEYMQENEKCFPVFPSLNYLEFQCDSAPILHEIIKGTPKLSSLATERLFAESAKVLSEAPLTNLKLHRGLICLESLPYLNSDLTDLWMESRDISQNEEISFNELLHAIKGFTNLKSLTIKATLFFNKKSVVSIRNIQFPKVKELRLWNCYKGICENEMNILSGILETKGYFAKILMHFPSIRNLYIFDRSIGSMSLIEENTSAAIIYRSNIWTRLHSLESMCLRIEYPRPPERKYPNVRRPTFPPTVCNFTEWTRDEYITFHGTKKRYQEME